METLWIVRLIGYVLAGVGAGYLGSLLLCRCAASKVVSNRRIMAVAGGLAGVGLTFAIGVADTTTAPSLEPLTTLNQLDDALAAAVDMPVVVGFYAEWCPPCGKLMPTMESLQQDWEDQVRIYKVDVDEATQLRKRFDIRSVPTVVYFQSGCEVDRTIGVMGKPSLNKRLAKMVAKAHAAKPKP